MTTYAGYRDLTDLIDHICAQHKPPLSHSAFSKAIGFRRVYIGLVYKKKFKPSKKAADKIASFANIDPHIVRVLCGLESPPPALDEKQIREINDLSAKLSTGERGQVIDYIKYISHRKLSS